MPTPILPNASTANTDSTATNSAAVTTAQDAFIANVTVLINNAIANGGFYVQPLSVPLVSSSFVTTYFENLGYTVVFPIIPSYPYNPAFIPGFPEVLPPGYQIPLYNTYAGLGPPRYQISWSAA
jgi:hypothetical protein